MWDWAGADSCVHVEAKVLCPTGMSASISAVGS
jgi:hypothetical protein